MMAAAALIVASDLAPHIAAGAAAGDQAHRSPAARPQRPGREVIQVLVEFAPGVAFPKHSHPGEEIVYVIEGVLEYALEGKPR